MENELIRAIEVLKERKWVDLTHTFGLDSPHFAAFPDAEFKTLFDLMINEALVNTVAFLF